MPPHYLSPPIWVLTTVYVIIALLVLVTGGSTLASYVALKRQRQHSTEGNKMQLVGWRKVIAEVTDVKAMWSISFGAVLLVTILGMVTGSILLMLSLFLYSHFLPP